MAYLVKRGKYWHIYYHDRSTGNTRSFSTHSSDRSIALTAKKELVAKQRLGLLTGGFRKDHAPSVTLPQLCEIYNSTRELSHGRKTAQKNAIQHWHDCNSQKPINHYIEDDEGRYLVFLKERGLTANTITMYHAIIYALFKFAVRKHRLLQSPLSETRTMIPKRVVPVTQRDLAIILSAAQEETKHRRLHDFIKIAYLLALRINEAATLRAEDFDFPEGLVYVRNTKAGRVDTIPLLDEVREAVQGMGLKVGKLFPYDRHTAANTFRKLMAKCGMNYTFHQLRKARGTILANSGVEPLYLQTYLRHANIKETLTYYVQLDMGNMKESIEKKVAKLLQ